MCRMKLYAFPFAGGSSWSYSRWKKHVSESVELIPVELAGRGSRLKEPFYDSFRNAAEDLYDQIGSGIADVPYAFFGHSMGCLLAYELAFMIKERGGREPAVLFLSGRWPPHIKRSGMVVSTFPDERLKERLLELGGATPELFENNQLAETFIPILRADFYMMETYVYEPARDPLSATIHVMTGTRDWDVNQPDLAEWRNYTTGECTIQKFKGGHFYINESLEMMIQHINRILKGCESRSNEH